MSQLVSRQVIIKANEIFSARCKYPWKLLEVRRNELANEGSGTCARVETCTFICRSGDMAGSRAQLRPREELKLMFSWAPLSNQLKWVPGRRHGEVTTLVLILTSSSIECHLSIKTIYMPINAYVSTTCKAHACWRKFFTVR